MFVVAWLVSTCAFAGPTLDGRRFGQPVELSELALQKRLEAISRLEDLVRHPPRGLEAEMASRLANLYFEQGRALYLAEMANLDEQQARCEAQPGCDPSRVEANHGGSRMWHERSVRGYQALLLAYPRYEKADEATFFLGSAQADLGRAVEAVEAFKQLVRLYPESAYVPDAYVSIGDYYFNVEDNAFGALAAYRRATAYRDHARYPYAEYMLAWSAYNVGDIDAAVDSMKRVIAHSREDEDAPGALELEDEAVGDVVRFCVDADRLDELIVYLTEIGRVERIRPALARAAELWVERGEANPAIALWRRLILDDPTSPENLEFQLSIVRAYRAIGRRDEALEELRRLTVTGGDAALPLVEPLLRELAFDTHADARKRDRTPDGDALYALARTIYALYVDTFPGDPNAYEVHYNYAELLYKLGDFAGAYSHYVAVVDLDPAGPRSRFCAESAIFAAEEQVRREGGAAAVGSRRVAGILEPQPLTPWEQRLVDACDRYARDYGGTKLEGVLYKAAYVLYDHHRFEEASQQFQKIIALDPRSKQAELAADLILDALAIQEQWAELVRTAKVFYDQPGLGTGGFKQDVLEIYRNATFKQVEARFAVDRDAGAAGDGFMAFTQEFPDGPLVARALNNAAAHYDKAGRVDDAMSARHLLVDDPRFGPSTRYYPEQLALLGYGYESLARFDRAAELYERLWSWFVDGDHPELAARAGEAVYSAAVFRHALGDRPQATADYQAFVDRFTDDPRVSDVKLRIGKIAEADGRWQDAVAIYQAFDREPTSSVEQRTFARLHGGIALDALGRRQDRDALYRDTIRGFDRGSAGPERDLVARMQLVLVQDDIERFRRLTLHGAGGAGPGASRAAEDAAYAKSVAQKTRLMLDLQRELEAVVATGSGEWGIASLVALGKLYDEFAQAFRAAELPSYLTGDQAELYRSAVADQAYAMDERAAAHYLLAVETSCRLTWYDDASAYAVRRLGELRPDDHPGVLEQLPEPRYLVSKIARFSFEPTL